VALVTEARRPDRRVALDDPITARKSLVRGGLVVVAVTPAWVGLWAEIAPRSFYGSFPGAGRHWVAALGAYDEHLVRDVGALELGMLVLLVIAAITLERTLVQAALIAYACASLPHFVYHLTTLDRLPALDNAASLAGLALNVALPIGLLYAIRRARPGEARKPAAD
jgi:hypothetical protein